MPDFSKHSHIKAAVLSEGVRFSTEFLKHYGKPFLFKRRAYGNSDDIKFWNANIPQEMFLKESGLVCGIHGREASNWVLDYIDDEYWLCRNDERSVILDFPKEPNFYNETLNSQKKGNQLGTLYGGNSLGIFVYGSCALVDMKAACQYCSIEPNRERQTEFVKVVKPSDVYDLVKIALESDHGKFSQVMINGGNFTDRDKGFKYYTKVCEAARRAINDTQCADTVELHLIVFPPKNKKLFQDLANFNVSVAMNSEVHDPVLFEKYCPGKVIIGGQKEILESLENASKYLGQGKVYSIFVGGLEPITSLKKGIYEALDHGATPVINVFHADPGTPLSNHPLPSTEFIIEAGKILQEAYMPHDYITPFYDGCGRNALDSEAYHKLW